jgi:hypothetical protein
MGDSIQERLNALTPEEQLAYETALQEEIKGLSDRAFQRVHDNKQATLGQQYRQEMLANRGAGSQKGAEIKGKYRELGLDVDRVSIVR